MVSYVTILLQRFLVLALRVKCSPAVLLKPETLVIMHRDFVASLFEKYSDNILALLHVTSLHSVAC